MAMMMSAICVQKGGIALENYVGRFFAADTLEFVAVKDLTTPTQKPIYEMTLEEFEKIMNI